MRAALQAWYDRARQVIDGRDLLLLTPPGILSILARGAYCRWTGTQLPPCDNLDARDEALVDVFADLARTLGRYYFRLQLRGVENVPASGPAILVGNHNGGALPLDSLFTALAIYDGLGPSRVVHGLAHDALFFDPKIRDYALRLGVVRARPGVADQVLVRGRLVLVYPRSD